MKLDTKGSGLSFDLGRLKDVLLVVFAALMIVVLSAVAQRPAFRVDIATLIIVYLALERELIAGMLLSLSVGYLADLFSGQPPGLYMASEVMVFLGLRLFVFRIVGSRFLIVTGIGLTSTLVALLLRSIIQGVLGPARPAFSAMAPAWAALLVGPILLGYPIHTALRLIDARFKTREDAFGAKT